ncbi:MAG TPA: Crp/Fnr family transcriptional regulator [Gemmatimonadales bacterium]|nr:Crp/Fnr family transcriptional regulator [Gemmatimonadales bacterium]
MTEPIPEAYALLRNLQVFADLDDDTVSLLADRTVVRNVPAGHVLFTTGDECRGLYVISAGRVRIFRTSNEGREQVLHVEGPGRPVAELPLFDGGVYPASALTLEPSRLAFLPLSVFEHVYRSNPDVAHAIIRALGRRLRHMVQVTETLAFRDVAARLAMLLAGYADEAGIGDDGSAVLALNRTQEELALEIGTARESVSRAWRQLMQRGLVQRVGRQRVRIPDVDKLRSLARGGQAARQP